MDKTWIRLTIILIVVLLAFSVWELLSAVFGVKIDVQVAVNPIQSGLFTPQVEKFLTTKLAEEK